jgi:hypothetical protein
MFHCLQWLDQEAVRLLFSVGLLLKQLYKQKYKISGEGTVKSLLCLIKQSVKMYWELRDIATNY